MVVSVATLTGACVIALGHHISAVFTNYDPLADQLRTAGEIALDPVWQMPMSDEYQLQLNSNFADIEISLANQIVVTLEQTAQVYDTSCRVTQTVTHNVGSGPYAIDDNGKAYYYNTTSGTLSRYSSTGVFGTGEKIETNLPQKSNLGSPVDMEVDSSNRLYILSSTQSRIYVYNSTTFDHLCIIGDGRGSSSRSGHLLDPKGFSVMGDKVYVADSSNNRIVKFLMSTACTGGASITGNPSFDGVYGKSESRIAIARRVLKKLITDVIETSF